MTETNPTAPIGAVPQPGGPADLSALVTQPFGAFAPPAWFRRFRQAMLAAQGLPAVGRLAYKLLAHVTKRAAPVADITYLDARFRMLPRENGQDRWVLRRHRHPEEEELTSLGRLGGAPRVFVDIGANNGYFSVIAARRLPAGSSVIAFEPHPRTFRKLLMNLALNDLAGVETHNIAVGPEETRMTLHSSDDADGGNSLVMGQGDGPTVPVRPLLSVLQESAVEAIDLLKIDVEGFEDSALAPFLKAAPPTLLPARVIIEKTNRATVWREDCFALLESLDYRAVAETLDNVWFVRGLDDAAVDAWVGPARRTG